MIQVLRRAQTSHKAVTISTVIVSTLNLGQMGSLMNQGCRLVLCVTSAAQGGQLVEEQRAVRHVALAGKRVCDNAGRAGAVYIGAVGAAGTAGGRAALGGDAAEDGCDGGSSRGGFEVFGQFGGVGCCGGLRSRGLVIIVGCRVIHKLMEGSMRLETYQAATVGQSGSDYVEASTGTVRLERSALLVVGSVHLGSSCTIDGGGNLVGGERNGTSNVSRVSLGIGEGALRDDVKGAATAEVVHLSNVKSLLDRLTCGDGLEGFLRDVGGQQTETESIESDLRLCEERPWSV